MATTRDIHHPTTPGTFDFLRENARLALAVVLGFGVLAIAAALATHLSESDQTPAAAFAGLEVTPPKALPTLALDRTDGTTWSSEETGDTLSMFFFGYTHCPDICPLTLSRANQVHQKLGEDAAKVDFFFITVDPERDTPERLGTYVSQFNSDFTGLTGSHDQLEIAKSAFGVVAVRHEQHSGGYTVDHTASSYLVDGSGQMRLIYPHDAPSADVANDIRVLLAEMEN